MKTTCLIPLVLLSFVLGCLTPKSAEKLARSPGVALTLEATDFLMRLKDEGKLPGVGKDDHGSMDGKIRNRDLATFPYTGTFQLKKEGDKTLYHYTVSKQTQTSPWQLQRASQTDSRNKIIKEFPIE